MAHVTPEVAQAITRQKARYARYADLKLWDKWVDDIFLPDARATYNDTQGQPLTIAGRAMAFDSAHGAAAFLEPIFAQLDTLHNITPGDFEKVSDTEVRAVFGFEDNLLSKTLRHWAELRGGGYYNETWKLVDGQWYISDLRMVRTYQKMTFLVWLAHSIVNLFGITL